jgi:ribonuclease HII
VAGSQPRGRNERQAAASRGRLARRRAFAARARRSAAEQARRAALPEVTRPVGYTPRRGSGLTGYERVLVRAGLGPVAGIDEAGRGACAGPLVVAAVALDRWENPGTSQIADSKILTAHAREKAYRHIVRTALAWHVVIIDPGDIDRLGLHVCNVAGMRRALAGLEVSPGYVLTDGFEVPGLAAPALAMWKGDQVAACVAAASIIAKVTRDRIMRDLSAQHPEYGFARHKGYSTPSHMAALEAHGPSPIHRRSFVNVSSRLDIAGLPVDLIPPDDELLADALAAAGRLAGLDGSADGPIVELFAGSPASAPRGEHPDQSAALAARTPASSKGRT